MAWLARLLGAVGSAYNAVCDTLSGSCLERLSFRTSNAYQRGVGHWMTLFSWLGKLWSSWIFVVPRFIILQIVECKAPALVVILIIWIASVSILSQLQSVIGDTLQSFGLGALMNNAPTPPYVSLIDSPLGNTTNTTTPLPSVLDDFIHVSNLTSDFLYVQKALGIAEQSVTHADIIVTGRCRPLTIIH